MKQTAVEFLMEKLFDPSTMVQEQIQWFEQAKEMEKEQIRTILLAYNEERNDRTDGSENYWEPYEVDDFLEEYNKTFNINEK
jgi:hypothetical protein